MEGPSKAQEAEQYQSLYKDSVAILGVSLDEFQEFMNPEKPTRDEKTSVQAVLQKLQQISATHDESALSQVVTQKSSIIDGPAGKPGLQLLDDIEMLQRYCAKVVESLMGD